MGASKPDAQQRARSPSAKAFKTVTFAHLSPQIRHISQTTIRKKWRPLPQSSQDRIRGILLSLKARRGGAKDPGRVPALGVVKKRGRPPKNLGQTDQDKVKKTKRDRLDDEYDHAVEMVTEKLLLRLPRMPFPPSHGTGNSSSNTNASNIVPSTSSSSSSTTQTDDAFSLESTLHRINNLQAQLAMHNSTAHLLRAQMKREKRALRHDRAELETLEAGLKSEIRLRKVKDRGLHPIVARLDDLEDQENHHDDDDPETSTDDEHLHADNNDDDDADRDAHTTRPGKPVRGLSKKQKPTDHDPSHRLIRLARPSNNNNATAAADVDLGQNPDMQPLLQQLRNHLVSMQTNTAGLRPVLRAIDETKVAMDQFVATRFGPEDRRRVYGIQ